MIRLIGVVSGPQQQMKVVVQETVPVEFKGLPLLQVAEGLQERVEVGLFVEHVLAAVAAVDDVINQALPGRSQWCGMPRV